MAEALTRDDIQKQLTFISTYFVQTDNQCNILGKPPATGGTNPATTHLLSYTNFAASGTSTFLNNSSDFGVVTATDDTVIPKVLILRVDASGVATWNTGNAFTDNNIFDDDSKINTYAATVKEINFTRIIETNRGTVSFDTLNGGTAKTFGAAGVKNPLLDLLDCIRVTYNVLEDTKFKRYKADDSTLTIPMYSGVYTAAAGNNPATYVHTLASPTTIKACVDKIIPDIAKLDVKKSNINAIRRLLLGYETLIHGYIAIYIGRSNVATDQRLFKIVLARLAKINNDLSTTETGVTSFQARLKERINEYVTKLKNIDDISDTLTDMKESVDDKKEGLAANTSRLNKSTILFYVFMSVFVICSLVLAGVILSSRQGDIDINQLKPIVGGVFIVSIVSLVILYFVTRMINVETLPTVVEKFALSSATDDSLALLQQFNNYLEHTIAISLLYDNYKRYGEIISAINKEANIYDGLNSRLLLHSESLIDQQSNKYRASKIFQYRIYLLLQILIIVTVFTFIDLYNPSNPYIFVVMMVLVLFALYMYVISTNNLVHTDATKLYWGQPSQALLR